MAFSGVGDDEENVLTLPGGMSPVPKGITREDFLIAQLNRFKGAGVPAGQSIGDTKIGAGSGITDSVALDALTIVIRRLTGSLQSINDPGAATLLASARGILSSGDASGLGAAASYVKQHVLEIAITVGGFADSLGLPPPVFPTTVAGLSGVKLAVAAGAVGVIGLLLLRRGRP